MNEFIVFCKISNNILLLQQKPPTSQGVALNVLQYYNNNNDKHIGNILGQTPGQYSNRNIFLNPSFQPALELVEGLQIPDGHW